jgi:hypothetical protein
VPEEKKTGLQYSLYGHRVLSGTIECPKCGARNTFHLRPTQHTVKLTCRGVDCEEAFKVTIEEQSSIQKPDDLKATFDRFGKEPWR